MITSCNPGRWLLLEARLELARSDASRQRLYVVDRELGEEVSLAQLLERFRADPTDDVLGPLRITIEAGP